MITVRDAIVAMLAGVPEIGVVHAYERYSHDLAKFKQLYVSPAHGDVRGWFVRRIRMQSTCIQKPIYQDVTTWRVQGYMGLNDAASDAVANDLIDAAIAASQADSTLGGVVLATGPLGTNRPRGLQLDDFGPVMFGGVLCHGIRFSLITTSERHS